jgi:hypothetical protein
MAALRQPVRATLAAYRAANAPGSPAAWASPIEAGLPVGYYLEVFSAGHQRAVGGRVERLEASGQFKPTVLR